MSELVHYESRDGIATITLDDGKVNAMSPAMQTAIHGALDRAENDGAAIILRGRPGLFSGGFDLATLGGDTDGAIAMVRGGFELAARVQEIPAPVVMACTGHAVAMGTFLLLSGDYLLGAAGDYKLTANEVAIGLTVPWPAIEILRHRLTPAASDRAAITAEVFGTHNAVESGFLDRVVAPDELDAAALETANRLIALDRASYVATKKRRRECVVRAIRDGIARDLAQA